MPTRKVEDPDAPADIPARPKKPGVPWRMRLRSLHRDFGFFAVGLTVIYAVSGIAVNHINDWNPSFRDYQRTLTLPVALPEDDKQAARVILDALDIADEPSDVYGVRETIVRYEFTADGYELKVRPDLGEILVTPKDGEPRKVKLDEPLPADDWRAALTALSIAGIMGEPDAPIQRVTIPIRDLTISFERRTISVQDLGDEADIFEQGEKRRFFLYVANWLHLNRGKAAWTYIADFYALTLLFLAFSGMLMVRGKQGVFGRGGVFLLIGIAVPVVYIIAAGP